MKNFIIEAYSNLTHNKFRSILSILGIIIGTIAIFCIISLTLTAKNYFNNQFKLLGTNLLWVTPDYSNAKIDQKITYFNLENIKKLVKLTPSIINFSPIRTEQINIFINNQDLTLEIIGTNQQYSEIKNVQLNSGRFLHNLDITSGEKVALVNKALFNHLKTKGNARDLTINLKNEVFSIIGVIEKQKQDLISGVAKNEYIVIIPITTFNRLFKNNDNIEIFYLTKNEHTNISQLKNQIIENIAKIYPNESFSVNSFDEIIEASNKLGIALTIIFGSLGFISLFIGGIGVMNIMLVSVTERYNEIGLRKAVGARDKDILWLFIFETIFICLLGGFSGIAISSIFVLIINSFLKINTFIFFTPFIISISFNFLIALIFGIYPAYKAAQLNPVEALRKVF